MIKDVEFWAVTLTALFWWGIVLALAKMFAPYLFTAFLYFGSFFVGLLTLVILFVFSYRIFERLILTLRDFFTDFHSHY